VLLRAGLCETLPSLASLHELHVQGLMPTAACLLAVSRLRPRLRKLSISLRRCLVTKEDATALRCVTRACVCARCAFESAALMLGVLCSWPA
jgi:hypothetical protein